MILESKRNIWEYRKREREKDREWVRERERERERERKLKMNTKYICENMPRLGYNIMTIFKMAMVPRRIAKWLYVGEP